MSSAYRVTEYEYATAMRSRVVQRRCVAVRNGGAYAAPSASGAYRVTEYEYPTAVRGRTQRRCVAIRNCGAYAVQSLAARTRESRALSEREESPEIVEIGRRNSRQKKPPTKRTIFSDSFVMIIDIVYKCL